MVAIKYDISEQEHRNLNKKYKSNFHGATTIRMDVDTVSKKNSHEQILNKFKNENIDVTLVGVIAADSSLNIDDYRANERTFQILTQVARTSW